MREREVEQYFIRRVHETGGLQRKFVSPGVRAVMDRLCGFPGGRFAFAEIKPPGGKPRPEQEREHNRWRLLGILVFVLDTKESVDVFIEYMTR